MASFRRGVGLRSGEDEGSPCAPLPVRSVAGKTQLALPQHADEHRPKDSIYSYVALVAARQPAAVGISNGTGLVVPTFP